MRIQQIWVVFLIFKRYLKLQADEYDGKVVYVAKRLEQSVTYEGHVGQLNSLVGGLLEFE